MIITTGISEARRQRIRTDPVRKEIRMFDAENLVKKGNVVRSTVFTKFGLTAMYTTLFFCTTSLLSNDV